MFVGNLHHESVQSYLDGVYGEFLNEIQKTLHYKGNEIYGEILYHSAVKLLKYLKLSPDDVLLDIGSGLGKFLWYVYFNAIVRQMLGVEINAARANIAKQVQAKIRSQGYTDNILFEQSDILNRSLEDVTVVYMCSTIFSYDLLERIGFKLNKLPNLKRIASFRKIPHLTTFKLAHKILIHCSWERVWCYVYEK